MPDRFLLTLTPSLRFQAVCTVCAFTGPQQIYQEIALMDGYNHMWLTEHAVAMWERHVNERSDG